MFCIFKLFTPGGRVVAGSNPVIPTVNKGVVCLHGSFFCTLLPVCAAKQIQITCKFYVDNLLKIEFLQSKLS